MKTIKTAYGQPLETSPTLQGTCSENVIVTSKGPVFVSESVMAGCCLTLRLYVIWTVSGAVCLTLSMQTKFFSNHFKNSVSAELSV